MRAAATLQNKQAREPNGERSGAKVKHGPSRFEPSIYGFERGCPSHEERFNLCGDVVRGSSNEGRKRSSSGCCLVRDTRAAAVLLGIAIASQSKAADQWGGSAAISSDYHVRGIFPTSG